MAGGGTPGRILFSVMDAPHNNQATLSTKRPERSFTSVHSDIDNDEVLSNSDRFFIIHSSDEAVPISKLSPFAIDKCLKCKIGTLNTIRKLRSRDILVELSSPSQIQAITKLKQIMDRPVTVTPHKTPVSYTHLTLPTNREV